jgi:hypothetical protein
VPSNMAYMVRLGSFVYSNLPEMLQRMHSAPRLLHPPGLYHVRCLGPAWSLLVCHKSVPR